MPATTVKLDSEILREIGNTKPRSQTLTAYVREAIRRDLRRAQMRKAAEQFAALLRDNATERQELDQWENAALARAPRRKKK